MNDLNLKNFNKYHIKHHNAKKEKALPHPMNDVRYPSLANFPKKKNHMKEYRMTLDTKYTLFVSRQEYMIDHETKVKNAL